MNFQHLDISKRSRLPREFYHQQTEIVAENLLGCSLIRVLSDGSLLRGIICETEAYLGEFDTACHTSSGLTPRNKVMYEDGGKAYVYFIYGIHYMLNVVTERAGKGCAVLIRSVIPVEGKEIMAKNRNYKFPLTEGPARLTQAFQIHQEHNGLDLVTSSELYLLEGEIPTESTMIRTPRIGIDYASKKDKDALLRFVLKVR